LEETNDPTKLLDLPSQILDKVVEVLAKVGIELPALVLQLFLFVLVLLTLFVAMRQLWPDWRNAKLLPLLGAGGIALVAIGILFGMASQAALPDRLKGRVSGQELTDVKIELLDFRREAVSTGGTADTQTGEFIAYYSPIWNGRARTLRISSPSCKPREQAIPRGRLARGTETTWAFPCEKP
jgi:hypothetical protein